jgi:DNA topoisomerase-1
MTNLLIVESPAKCKKIQGFLGAGWRVQATMGHIRSLQEDLKAIGFDPTKGSAQAWTPAYEAIAAKREAIASLRKAAAGCTVYLGADDDREGEAIAWHTCAVLGLDPATTPRVIFHEITEPALKAAVASPGRIDMNKFNAQQARTMLDMLIGFTLSPCLWRSVGYKAGLSAGRCQTPALRIIYDRDVQIEAHTATFSWAVKCNTADSLLWTAKEPCATEAEATALLQTLAVGPKDSKVLAITDRQERIATSQPPKPFITSSLQQEASSRLAMNPKITMRAAQTLYEAGHITYMRTDNAVLSQEAVDAASAVVTAKWGAAYLGSVVPVEGAKKKVVKKKVAATEAPVASPQAASVAPQQAHEVSGKPGTTASAPQAAHEAIRPTHMDLETVDDLSAQEQRLYTLIRNRTLQTVMAPETRDVVKLTAVTAVTAASLQMQTEWDRTKFAGWRVLDTERKVEEERIAGEVFVARQALAAGQKSPWTVFTATEVRTSPPSRYTEASLIRELEHKGIGRPSTYATLVETVLDRGYVEKATIAATPVTVKGLELKATAKEPKATTKTEKSGGEKDKLRATPLGRTVIEWLLGQFGDLLAYDFTASMESQLDEVAKGSRPWSSVLQETWTTYADRYATIMSGPSTGGAGGGSSANKAEYGDGYKMVVSKKGPLFVLEKDGEKTRFANVPAHLSIQTATRADAESAFTATAAASAGEALGDLEGHPVTRKKGPYGHYVTWQGHNVNCKEDEALTDIAPRLLAKATPAADAVDHQVGPYKIKKGPYGLYMFKSVPGSKTKPTFVSIPAETAWATLTTEGAELLYKSSAAAVKERGTTATSSASRGRGRGRGRGGSALP